MTAPAGSRPRLATAFGWRTVTPLVMGSALNPINSSAIATALVPIAAALHVPVGRTLILVSSLYLACAIAQPAAGKLAEEFGPRRVVLTGIVLVLLGGVVGGLLNVPLTAAALAITLAWVPRDGQPAAGRKIAEITKRIDLGGIVLFGGMLAAPLVFLMSLPRAGWAALAISAVLAALLAARELRAARPFIDLRLLASSRALTRTYLVSFPVSRRNLVRGPLLACAFFMLLASVATLFITGRSPVIALVGMMVLFGVVVGTTSVGNQTALHLQSPPESLGTASGLSRTFGYVGSIASATITSIVFRTRVSDAGLHDMAIILVGVAAVVLLMTLLDRQLPRGLQGLSGHAWHCRRVAA